MSPVRAGETAHHASPALGDLDVGIVHESLVQRGGAERTALEMARMWPEAPIYTPLYRPQSTYAEFQEHLVRASALNPLPVTDRFRSLFLLYPFAMRSLGVLDHDLVLSSSAGWTHGVRTSPRATHVVYCHAPARWLYETDRYVDSPARRALIRPALAGLKRWDQRAAGSADAYIANAENVRRRIQAAYGIDAPVVHPPVDTDRFTPSPRGERLLVVSRLLPYKRVDLAVQGAAAAGIGLDVVGSGPLLARFRRQAGAGVTFHGSVSDERLRELIQGCWALCMPGAEDFGIAPLEGNAAGKPVIAFAERGATETVINGVTGILFKEQTVSALTEAIKRAESLSFGPELLAQHATRYSVDQFRRNLTAELEAILVRRDGSWIGL
jgi:glycosyltransferase involved in cell wall biosynthesis